MKSVRLTATVCVSVTLACSPAVTYIRDEPLAQGPFIGLDGARLGAGGVFQNDIDSCAGFPLEVNGQTTAWLTAAHVAGDGRLPHGEMRAGDGLIMLASPTPDYRGPKRHRETCEQARRWSAVPWVVDGVLVIVRRLDRHFARAKAAGATILSEIEEGPPGRRYRAEDLEGHRWFFLEEERTKPKAG